MKEKCRFCGATYPLGADHTADMCERQKDRNLLELGKPYTCCGQIGLHREKCDRWERFRKLGLT